MALGEGEIPVRQAMKILEKAGYNGVWCIEYEGKEGAEGYRKSLEWLKKAGI